jgi:hypothetical protein
MAKLTNVVMVANIEGRLNIEAIGICLPILDFGFDRKKKMKIPYFGVDGAIVSIGHSGVHRGIRKEGQLPNIVSVDLQLGPSSLAGMEGVEGKNVHIKISSQCLHVTGVRNELMGHIAFATIIAHIKMANDHQSHIRSLSVEDREATIHGAGAGDERFRLYASMFAHEYLRGEPGDVDRYADFLRKLASSPPLIDGPCRIRNARVCNSIYTYKVAPSLSLIETSRMLHEKGLGVMYCNWKSDKFMRAILPVYVPGTHEYAGPHLNRKGKEQVDAHRFQIYKTGTIRQYSPTSYAAAIEAAESIRAHFSLSAEPADSPRNAEGR